MSDRSEETRLGGLTPVLLAKLARSGERVKHQRGELKKQYRVVARLKMLWWQGRWRDYSDLNASGKPKYRKRWLASVATCSKGDAQRQLDLLIIKTNSGEHLPDVNLTFGELWERYLALKSARWSDASRRSVEPTFRYHVLPVIGKIRVRDLTPWKLQQLVSALAANDLSFSVCAKVRTHSKAALAMAVEDEIIAKNPANKLEVPPTKAADERFLLIDEIRGLLAQLEGRDRLVVRLLVECGFRPAELFALRWDDLYGSFLRVDETARNGKVKHSAKNRGSQAYVPVSGALLEALDVMRAETSPAETDFLFPSERGTPIHYGNFLRRVLKPAAKRAGISDVTFQALRRTCSTHILSMGNVKDAQRLLRHNSPLTTLKHYAKSIPESLTLAVEAFSQEITGGPAAGRLM